MLLKDMTIIKFMFSAIAIGGTLFGVSLAIAGFCPGTSVGELVEGRIRALWAILGMLFGAAALCLSIPFYLHHSP